MEEISDDWNRKRICRKLYSSIHVSSDGDTDGQAMVRYRCSRLAIWYGAMEASHGSRYPLPFGSNK